MTPPQAHPLDEALRAALRDWQDLQPARRAALRALATELQEAAA